MLAIVLAPYGQIPGAYPSEIAYSYGGSGAYEGPDDPMQFQRGEYGIYSDTMLGRANLGQQPTDMDYAGNYQWTPVTAGWVASAEGYHPGAWVPPNGWNAAGAYGPKSWPLSGLRDAPPIPTATKAEADSVVQALNDHNDKMFKVTLVSTAIISVSALITMWRTLRMIRRDEAQLRSRSK